MKPRRPYTTDLRATQRALPPEIRPRNSHHQYPPWFWWWLVADALVLTAIVLAAVLYS